MKATEKSAESIYREIRTERERVEAEWKEYMESGGDPDGKVRSYYEGWRDALAALDPLGEWGVQPATAGKDGER